MVVNWVSSSSVVEMTECVIKLYKHFRIPTYLTTTKLALYLSISSLAISCYNKNYVNETVIMKKPGKLMNDIKNLPLIHSDTINNSNLLSKYLKFEDVAVIDISKIHLENTWISISNPVDVLMHAIVNWFSAYSSVELADMLADLQESLSDHSNSEYWVIDSKKLTDIRNNWLYKDNKIIQFINYYDKTMEGFNNG